MKTRQISSLLLALLLASSALVSCGSAEKSGGAVSDTAAPSDSSSTEATTEFRYTAAVPDSNFEGAEFRQLGIDPDTYNICLDFEVEQQTGDVLKDSIYTRNITIEDRYNCKFKSTYMTNWWDATDTVKNMVLAGSDDYDITMLINRDAFSSAQNGYLTNIADIPYIDITQPWYVKGINDQFSINGKLYFAYTDECVNMYLQDLIVCFNKQLVTNLNLDNPYALVTDGKWTLDSFESMAMAAISDVNGDGKFDKNDVFGVDSESDMIFPALWVSSNTRMVEKDKDDIPAYTLPTNEKLLGILDRMSGWSNIDGFYFDNFEEIKYDEQSRADGSVLFAGGLSLFRVGTMSVVFSLRNMDSDFGILPLPKYDEAQENYYGRMIDGWINVVPITNTKLEMTGILLEALGAESKNIVLPALYDVALKTKYSRDEESSAMLDIILANVTVDLGDTVWQESIRANFVSMCLKGKSGFSSAAEKITDKVNKIITEAVEAIDEL